MGSTARLLSNSMYWFGKYLSPRSSAVGLRNFHIFECVNESISSSCLLSVSAASSFTLTKRTCVNSVTNVCNQETVTILRERVDLSQFPKARLEKIMSFFVNDGFQVDDGVNMVSKCPDILRKTEKEIDDVISALRSCGIRDEETKQILRSSPKILCCNVNTMISRYKTLKQMFSRQHIVQILSRCPNIMFIKWRNIEQNIDYLKNEMHVSEKQVAYSSALESPIEMIKARHVFLTRAGLYETPDPKSKLPSNNPSLSSIVDTDDVYFAESVANLTAEEYFVFLDMLEFENADRENEDDSEESE